MRGQSHPLLDALGCGLVIVIVLATLYIASATGIVPPG